MSSREFFTMRRRALAAILIAVLMICLTACSGSPAYSEEGAHKVAIGIGEDIVGSQPYVDHDKPTPTPTPTPEISATPMPTVTAAPTPVITNAPSGDGKFTKEDCVVIINDMRIIPGMDFTGKENEPGKVADKLEGVSCLQSGYDINYIYKDFRIDTIRQNERQYIYSAQFKGTGALTNAGIGIGSTEEDVITAYGAPTEDTNTQRIYKTGNWQMSFYIVDEKVTEIYLVDYSFQ